MDTLNTDACLIEPKDSEAYEPGQLVCRIQSFTPGGFEGVVYSRDRDAYRYNPLGIISGKERKTDPAEKAIENARRAKRTVRCKAREIGVDHLMTLTTRERENDPIQLMDRFAKFIHSYLRATGKTLLYVAVPEPHPSNVAHWHIHAAIKGRINLRVANAIWWRLCGGRGMGNVDIRGPRGRSDLAKTEKIARYISKYITKGFDVAFPFEGRRRFRSSIVALLPKQKMIMRSRDFGRALSELLERLNLFRGDLRVFYFPDGSGFWFSCSGNVSVGTPPF